MPTVTVRRAIGAPQEEVWAAIADIERAARWNQTWQRIEFLSSQREGAGTTFRAHAEDGDVAEFEVVAWRPPEFIAFAPRPDPSGSGDYWITLESHAFYLQPAGGEGTELHLMATARSHGLRGWFRARVFWSDHQKPGLHRALEAIAALFEPEEAEGEDG
jgi:uncharacterized protein YndB with AHSA1/START domain